MLRLLGGQVESLWDEVLPGEVKELSEDLAALDVLLSDRRLLEPIALGWRREVVGQGRPSIAMDVYVRLMIVKARTGWGYETLVREVSDSLHLRRFCLIALGERVPHESTVRKLTRRLGYGLRRSRLKGAPGVRAWSAWAILAYNLDTLAIRTR